MKLLAFVFILTLGIASHAMAQNTAPAPAKSFEGFPCTQDCAGHEAGYKWAEEHDIDDPAKCGGTSKSFIEGCQAWASDADDDNKDAAENDDDRED
jgi:hypothetical protein